MLTDQDVDDILEDLHQLYGDETICREWVVQGAGCSLRVRNSELVAEDGWGPERRVRTLSRADATGVARVVVEGAGYVTTEALAWLHGVGVALVVVSGDDVLAAGCPSLCDHGGLRRAQALARGQESGLQVVRWLLGRRLEDQARLVEGAGFEQAAAAIRESAELVTTVTVNAQLSPTMLPCLEQVMLYEAAGALSFWECWESLELKCVSKDNKRIPKRWRRFGGRGSPLRNQRNRHAGDPLNAMLNYGYGVSLRRAVEACLRQGFDPAMGLLHADRLNRPSFALDLMEIGRGEVERVVWGWAKDRRFRKVDFMEGANGEVRLNPLLARELAGKLRFDFEPALVTIRQMLMK